jgi:hypothetical protein
MVLFFVQFLRIGKSGDVFTWRAGALVASAASRRKVGSRLWSRSISCGSLFWKNYTSTIGPARASQQLNQGPLVAVRASTA